MSMSFLARAPSARISFHSIPYRPPGAKLFTPGARGAAAGKSFPVNGKKVSSGWKNPAGFSSEWKKFPRFFQ
jgi:hypothetical protein